MRILCTVTVWLFSLSLCAQSSSRVSFAEAINHYQTESNINFSFDSEVFDLISRDSKFETSDLKGFVLEVERQLPVVVEVIDEKYYTISIVESNYLLTLRDSTNYQTILKEEAFVLVNGKPLKTSKLESGYSFFYKPAISDTIEIFSLGYKKKIIPFEKLINGKTLSVALSSVVMHLAGMTVEGYLIKGIDLNPTNQSVNIAVRDLPLLPGETDGDIFAAITALPGVTTPDGRAGNLFIRGSETDQSLILFDNIPMYHRGHYYGTISPYNPKIVEEVEVFRSGFHPRFGGRVGGAIIVKSGQKPPVKPVFGATANTLYASLYSKIPLADNRLGLSVGVRRSYPREYQSPKLNAITESVFAATGVADNDGNILTDIDVLFEDYHGKLTFQADARNSFSLSAIYTNTDIGYIPVPPGDAPRGNDHNQFNNHGFNFDWRLKLNYNWVSLFSATISDYKFNFTSKVNAGGTDTNLLIYSASNELKDFNLKQEFSKYSSDNFSYQFGIDYKWQSVLTDFLNKEPNKENSFTYNNTVNSGSISPYANLEYNGSEKWYAQLGFRSTYYSNLQDFKFAPRLLVNYQASDWLSLKGSTGMYYQYLSQARNLEFGGGGFDNELWVLADKKSGNVIEGNQSMIGLTANYDRWIIDTECYFKTVNNISVFEERRLTLSQESFTMNQKSYGIDVMFKKQLVDDMSVWVGYSYNDSAIKLDTTNMETYQSKFVQPHVLYFGSAINSGNFKLSAVWNYSSGLNAKSLDIIYAEFIRLRNIANSPPGRNVPPNPFENLPNRYSNIHMLNVSASYKIPRTDKRKWEMIFGLSLVNVLNQKNLSDRLFRGRNGFVDRNALGFAPNLMVGIEF